VSENARKLNEPEVQDSFKGYYYDCNEPPMYTQIGQSKGTEPKQMTTIVQTTLQTAGNQD
jgi:hypothetical protein